MIDVIITILVLSLPAAIIFCVWAIICNERTFRQRGRIIDACTHEDFRIYGRVSYEQHLRALMRLKNPRSLYGADLWDRAQP